MAPEVHEYLVDDVDPGCTVVGASWDVSTWGENYGTSKHYSASGTGSGSVTWEAAPIRNVLLAFSTFSGKSIVPGAEVSGDVTAAELEAALAPLLSPRGSISVSPSTNTVIVSDVARVHRAIGGMLRVP